MTKAGCSSDTAGDSEGDMPCCNQSKTYEIENDDDPAPG